MVPLSIGPPPSPAAKQNKKKKRNILSAILAYSAYSQHDINTVAPSSAVLTGSWSGPRIRSGGTNKPRGSSRLGSGGVRNLMARVGSGRVASGRVGSGRVGSGLIGSQDSGYGRGGGSLRNG